MKSELCSRTGGLASETVTVTNTYKAPCPENRRINGCGGLVPARTMSPTAARWDGRPQPKGGAARLVVERQGRM